MPNASESQYFKKNELECKCGCGQALMDKNFLSKLDSLRWRYNQPIVLSSAYRCPDHNEKVSSTGRTGPHTTGKAVDIRVSGVRAHCLLILACQLQFKGIGVSQKGKHGSRFIHVDDVDDYTRPAVWSY